MKLYNPFSFTGNGRAVIAQMFFLVVTIVIIAGCGGFEAGAAGMVMADTLVVLTTGVGVNTPSGNQGQCESDILIGDADTAIPLSGIKVNIGGRTTMDVQGSQPLISVLAKFSNRICGTVISMILRIATGRILAKDVNTNITFTNAGATTPQIYWNSQRTGGRPIEAFTDGIIAAASKTVFGSDFAGLFVTSAANVGSFDVTFADDTQQRMTVVEADALFAKTNDTEANGRLDAVVTGFDNRNGSIKSVKINATAAVTYMTVK